MCLTLSISIHFSVWIAPLPAASHDSVVLPSTHTSISFCQAWMPLRTRARLRGTRRCCTETSRLALSGQSWLGHFNTTLFGGPLHTSEPCWAILYRNTWQSWGQSTQGSVARGFWSQGHWHFFGMSAELQAEWSCAINTDTFCFCRHLVLYFVFVHNQSNRQVLTGVIAHGLP